METIRFKANTKQYSFLSNFFPDVKHNTLGVNDVSFVYEGRKFRNSEHFYQYYKMKFIDEEYAEQLNWTMNSSQIKSISSMETYLEWKKKRTGTPKTKLRQNFKERIVNFDRVETMRQALVCKFSHPVLCEALIATGDCLLEEVGRFPDFWTSTGHNTLGVLLMETRGKVKTD